MEKLCALRNVLLSLLGKIKCFPQISTGNDRPRIYFIGGVRPRDAVASLCAEGSCVLVTQEEYDSDRLLRALKEKHLITAKGGMNTEWLHSALRRLSEGQSLLAFPDGKRASELSAAAVLLSLMSGAEIVPMYSTAADCGRHLFPRRRKLTAGKPLRPDENTRLTSEQLKKESGRLCTAISELHSAEPKCGE